MTRSELDSSEGEERLRRLSISVVRTLWGDHEGRCSNKACALCQAAAAEAAEQHQQRRHTLRAHEPPDFT